LKIFRYGETETSYLKAKDKQLGWAIAGGAIEGMKDYITKEVKKK
jgi:hypothetical protein